MVQGEQNDLAHGELAHRRMREAEAVEGALGPAGERGGDGGEAGGEIGQGALAAFQRALGLGERPR